MTASSSSSELSPVQHTGPHPRVAIVTDSIAQVPPDVVRQLNMHVIPFCVTVEGEKHMDIDSDFLSELYRRMRLEKDLQLTTSAPSTGVFYETFIDCLNRGADSVVYIGIASRLSQAFSVAETDEELRGL